MQIEKAERLSSSVRNPQSTFRNQRGCFFCEAASLLSQPDSTLFRLEEQLHSKLNLARRAGIARGKACVGDDAEGRASYLRSPAAGTRTRLAEVRMVEDVEDLSAELHTQSLGQVRVLDDREVSVVEGRTDDDVAPQISEVIAARRANYTERQKEDCARRTDAARSWITDQVIEPLVRAADNLHRTTHVRSKCSKPC